MHTLTIPDFRTILGVSHGTPQFWLTDLAPVMVGKKKTYRLADVIPRIRLRRPRGLTAVELRGLVEIDRVKRDFGDDVLFMGENAIGRAKFLSDCLTKSESERLLLCQSQMTAALVDTLLDRDIFTQIDDLRLVLVLHPDILAYVLTNDAGVLPNWREFAPAFAVVNAITIKEAA